MLKTNKKGLVRVRSAAVAATAVCSREQHIPQQQTPQKADIFHSLAPGSEVRQDGNITYQKHEGI